MDDICVHQEDCAAVKTSQAKLKEAIEGIKTIADSIQYHDSFDNPAYNECWELINKLENN
jgi:hypothetical protein